jgi:regulatory protein
MVGRRRSPEAAAARRERRAELEDPAPVMEAAAVFLGVRPRSVAETRRRLRHLGYPHGLVEHVVERLVEMEYLDDAEFARWWVGSRDRVRPRGESALRQELALKGVAREVVDLVLAERATDARGAIDSDGAVRLLERRRTSLERESDPGRRRQKAYALLARNGFDPQTCHEASAAFVSHDTEED